MPTADVVARGLGYVIGAGSLLLYTPIAIRVLRQRSADGLTESTWWLKLVSYTCSDIYFFTNGYPVSTYVETLVITVEAAVVLLLVAYFQRRHHTALDVHFGAGIVLYLVMSVWGLTLAPASVVALGQAGTAILNTVALVPQFLLNFKTQSSGDYSPITASLAAGGCFIRLFTTVQLAGSDPMLLFTFGLAFVVNCALLAQILWYGVFAEGRPISELLLADCVGGDRNSSNVNNYVMDQEEETSAVEEERQQELLIRARIQSHARDP
jgi:mannose-P-dolichol utilization defect 1